MPIATVQLPNGKIAEIEIPQGATPQEIESFVMSNPELNGQQPQQTQPAPQPQPQQQGSTIGNVARGLPVGLGRTATGFVQAATDLGEFGARKIEQSLYGDVMPQDTFGNRLARQVQQQNAQIAQEPLSTRIGVRIGESLPYLATGVGTGKKVAQVAGNVAGLAAGGAVGGAVSSALSPQEQAGLQNRALETAKGAAIGGVLGGTIGAVGKVANVVKNEAVQLGKDVLAGYKARPVEAIAGFTSKPVETLESISEAIKEGSSNAYKAMREAGAILKPETTESIFMNIDDSLRKSGILNPRLHGDTIGVLDDLKALSKEKNGAIGLEELDQYRQLLGDVIRKNTDIGGKINSDALKANIAIDTLDDIVDGLGANALSGTGNQNSIDLLNTAREEWKRYRKFDAITNIVKKADGDANRTKALLQNFVNNPKNLRGFSPTEVQALKRAKTNSTAEGLMKGLGKFGFDLGSGRNAGNTALPIGSILIGGVTGGLTTAVGTVARQAQKLSARGQIDDVLRLIQGQEPKIASKVIQQLSPKTRDFVITNILTQSINQTNNQ